MYGLREIDSVCVCVCVCVRSVSVWRVGREKREGEGGGVHQLIKLLIFENPSTAKSRVWGVYTCRYWLVLSLR